MITDGTYGVVWFYDKWTVRNKTHTFPVGICKAAERVAFIGTDLYPLVVHNLEVSGQVCEEGGRCLNLKCILNKTNWRTYRDQGPFGKIVSSKRRFDNIVSFMDQVQVDLLEQINEWARKEDGTVLFPHGFPEKGLWSP